MPQRQLNVAVMRRLCDLGLVVFSGATSQLEILLEY